MTAKKRRQRQDSARPTPARPGRDHGQGQVPFWIPALLVSGFLLVSLLPRVQGSPNLTWSFWGAGAVLLGWLGVVAVRSSTPLTRPPIVTVLRPQHYIQALVQLAVFGYWGWYWRPVYDYAWLLVAQLLFAYAFSMVLAWSRRQTYVLGCGPFPIIFSTNLFLWFRDDWFYLQFLMIAVGFMGKEFVTWTRDGRRTHIFNPSAFSLGIFSLVLIATNTTDLTRGVDIATTLTLAPNIYLFLFLAGLVVMYFFSITLLAGSAAMVLFGASALYALTTGVPYFVDSEIPSAVFLGLHLLVTDPSTSPRTPLGRTVFGVLYGLGVFVLYWTLGAIGTPTFYDKLLCVPLLNLSVQQIDRIVARISASVKRPPVGLWHIARGNAAHMAAWVLFFGAMTALGSTDGRHRGDTLPFWMELCEDGNARACERLVQIESNYCRDNSGWACNELGGHYRDGRSVEHDPVRAYSLFAQGCELRFQPACLNLLGPEEVIRSHPRVFDLRLLLREGGPNLLSMSDQTLSSRACDHGWTFACREGGGE